jgi:hypothetical protein
MENRLEANRELLKLLSEEIEKHPYFRFHQAMFNLGIYLPKSDEYYTESDTILKRVKELKGQGSA